jgi:hypothetical protein
MSSAVILIGSRLVMSSMGGSFLVTRHPESLAEKELSDFSPL